MFCCSRIRENSEAALIHPEFSRIRPQTDFQLKRPSRLSATERSLRLQVPISEGQRRSVFDRMVSRFLVHLTIQFQKIVGDALRVKTQTVLSAGFDE